MILSRILILLLMVPGLAYSKPSPSVEFAINNGWHAPYNQEFINSVITKPVYKYRETKFNFTYREPASMQTWATFAFLQALDVYTTYKGMQYDCVVEVNPLLPSRPNIAELLVLKTAILYPSYSYINSRQTLTRDDMFIPNVVSAVVVLNNLKTINDAKRRCSKI